MISYIEGKSNIWVHPFSPQKFPTFTEYLETDADFATLVLKFPDGRTYKSYNALFLGPYLSEVYSGDFNNDGMPDFMAIKPGTGCGLAAEYCIGVFAFSDGGGYRFTRVNTMGLGPKDLVLDPATKTFRLIHTSFHEATGMDGREHTFWVHRFYRWDAGAFRLDSNIPPVWIQYLQRPNHEPTRLLTPGQEARLLAEDSNTDVEW